MRNSTTFKTFIHNKPLYYKEIDHQRVHQAYALLQPHIRRPLTIHVVGTNGKGSTGRIMATLLHEEGKRVGHFSSPHILQFNERIWIEGDDVSDEVLEDVHKRLYTILGQKISDALSYFEYTTLLALVATQNMDVMILEAGLGGEFDATNVVKKELSVITPIGLDHQDFLGDSIEEIARTKLNSMDKKVLLARQIYDEVYTITKEISIEKKTTFYHVKKEENSVLLALTESLSWAYYLYENTLLSLQALDILSLPYRLNSLRKVALFGRFYALLPNVTIDVGHNLLASKTLVKALKKKYISEKVILVYNSLNDKNYEAILRDFKPLIKHVEIINIDSSRVIELTKLEDTLKRLEIEYKNFIFLNENDKYFIFGSFYVVEAFLKKINHTIKNK